MRKSIKTRNPVEPVSAMKSAGIPANEISTENFDTKRDHAKAKPKKVGGK
jgi:uncharacterized protein YggE